MESVLIAAGAALAYIIAYRTYGRFLARRIFRIDPNRQTPACEVNDGVDYVPSTRELVFGHHFTSIAGTGPIVGPAVALVWGWVPALIWVLLGSIVMGAVHDFGSLVVSMRHRGRTIADLAGDVVNPRVRVLFLAIVVVALWIVLAVFGLVIAVVFSVFPSSVVPVVAQIPIAVALGIWIRRGGSLILGSAVAVGLMYASIAWSGSMNWQSALNPEGIAILPAALTSIMSPIAIWTILLLVYASIASVLPVQTLLQPRDYINSHQLLIAMGLLGVGLVLARPEIVADAVNVTPEPASPGASVPSFMPFLFVTIACGAISGFHCLVASGCSSRQLSTEADAQYVGFGAMLTEGFLATLVILACAAGIGLGTVGADGAELFGREAWLHHYATWGGDKSLGDKLAPFIRGSANMIAEIGIDPRFALAIMGVFVASFAATTLDTSMRLQRYVIVEFTRVKTAKPSNAEKPDSGAPFIGLLGNRFVATSFAALTAAALALSDAWTNGWTNAGTGGLILWPVFGATNQLLGGLALLVITVWLVRQKRPPWVTLLPMLFMLAMTGWAILELLDLFLNPGAEQPIRWHLVAVAGMMLAFEVWIAAEAGVLIRRIIRERGGGGAAGVEEE